jgi:signal transduction histidine kinase
VEKTTKETYNLQQSKNVILNSYPIENADYINISNFMNSRLNEKLKEMIALNKSESILRLNIEVAVGVQLLFDLYGKPTALFMVVYPRDFNSFLEQGLFLFLFIILGFSIIIVSLLGLWFSKSIMIPIKNISNKMQLISNNPAMLETVPERYGGELGEMVGSFNNMNRSLEKYRKSLIEYKIITNNLDSGIFWLDSDLQIILCNPGFMRIVGKGKKSEVMSKKLTAFIDLKPIHLERSKKSTLTLPEIKLKNSKKFVVLNMKMAIDDSGKKFVGSLTEITSEISERNARQSLEFELIKSNKLAQIGRLAEGIVHNINSPLNSVLGYSQLIKKKLGPNEDLERVIEAGKNISQYVKVLLKKVRNDNISMLRPVNINEVISQELEMCQHNLFFKYYITLEKELDHNIPDLKIVHGDYSLCVANLLNNAIDSMRYQKQKDMFIRTYSENDNVVFEIRDTGEGILEKDKEHIFDPYFSTKSKTEKSGYGLGLAITKSIIGKYNGTIDVTSVKDSGSTFRVIVPVEQTGYKENYE